MLTPDQIQLRLELIDRAYVDNDIDRAVNEIISLLEDVLPELVALASGRTETVRFTELKERG
jgi:hypothetical protein